VPLIVKIKKKTKRNVASCKEYYRAANYVENFEKLIKGNA